MAGIKDLTNVWNNVKEIDLRPIAAAAQRPLRIALVGRQAGALAALAEAMRSDPSRPDRFTQTPLQLLPLEESAESAQADLIILVLDPSAADDRSEQALARSWANSGRTVLVVLPQPDENSVPPPQVAAPQATRTEASPQETPRTGTSSTQDSQPSPWQHRQYVSGSLDDAHFLTGVFSPAVVRLLPDHRLALARQFPLFRSIVAHELINDTCFSNTAYALSTGIAEIVPIFDVPLNIADMFVLSKAQAFLVYRLGLALGLSTQWRDYVAEFGGVLGGGFLWRQIARSLIGLIPAWGIVPKMAVSYAGTYVVGHVVYQWYLTGRHVSGAQMKQLYVQAFARGKKLAQNLREKLPRRKLKLISAGEQKGASLAPDLPLAKTPRRSLLTPRRKGKACSNCGKTSARDAQYCQYCGQTLDEPESSGA